MRKIRNFGKTGYPPDGATADEIAFEAALEDSKGLFTVSPAYLEGGKTGERHLSVGPEFAGGPRTAADGEESGVCALIPSLWGPESLPSSVQQHPEKAGDGEEAARATPSFRQDRRLLRRTIMQYFVENILQKFLRSQGHGES
eukprot:scaffold1071_cov252-Pinguiococcus_pyrenoidosus.AAC.15